MGEEGEKGREDRSPWRGLLQQIRPHCTCARAGNHDTGAALALFSAVALGATQPGAPDDAPLATTRSLRQLQGDPATRAGTRNSEDSEALAQ